MSRHFANSYFGHRLGVRRIGGQNCSPPWLLVRYQTTLVSSQTQKDERSLPTQHVEKADDSYMTRVTTWSLLRNIFISMFLTRPILLRPGMAIMKLVANSKSSFLNPDSNFLIRAALRPVVYDQFCAGTNATEVKRTMQGIKDLGFTGVALTYAKEIQLDKSGGMIGSHSNRDGQIHQWKDGNMQSLDMVTSDDWLAIKLTGAGEEVTEALIKGAEPPAAFITAMDAICEKAKSKNCRIWIDAEQQAIQPTIDIWTMQLMQRYNCERPLVYNTVQAYLKNSRQKLKHQLEVAEREGWICAIKLVRGAYIANDMRELIHDTKGNTDDSYNGIVHEMMTGTFERLSDKHFANARIMLAGHNSDTIRRALKLGKQLSAAGTLKVNPEFGQLQGMADDIGCYIVRCGEEAHQERRSAPVEHESREYFAPRAYKCLTWGTVQQCMQYLVRRAVENAAAVGRMKEGADGAKRELRRRLRATFTIRSTS